MDGFLLLKANFILEISPQITKFYSNTIAKIPPCILEPQNYKELKKTIIEAYESTKPELLNKLLSIATVTGRPSTYLQEMLVIAKHLGISNDIVLQALPQSVAPVITSPNDVTPSSLGKLADELM